MFQGGWNCDWFGIDNFLYTAFFGYQGGEPNPSYDYRNDEMNQAMLDALASSDEATQAENWGKAQDLIAGRHALRADRLRQDHRRRSRTT